MAARFKKEGIGDPPVGVVRQTLNPNDLNPSATLLRQRLTAAGTAAAKESGGGRGGATAAVNELVKDTGGTAAAAQRVMGIRQVTSNNYGIYAAPAAFIDTRAMDGDKGSATAAAKDGTAAAEESGGGRGGAAAAVNNVLRAVAAEHCHRQGQSSAGHGAKTLPELRERSTGGEGL